MNSLALKLKSYAFLFQGVGGKCDERINLFNEDQLQILKDYCNRAKREIELDLWEYIVSKSKEKYDEKFYDWITIYTCDCVVYDVYTKLGLSPNVLMGYSMGLITAITCNKSITYETGLNLLKCIYLYRKSTKDVEESMGAIIGYNYQQIINFIKEKNVEGKVMISSENNDTCIVISGIRDDVKKILEVCNARGAIKASEINAPYAFHSRYSLSGIEVFEKLVNKSDINDSMVPIFSVFNQTMITTEMDIRRELVKNMYMPMEWKKSMLMLGKCGINDYVEVSLNEDITKMSRIIDLDYKFHTYKKIIRVPF